LNPTLELTHSPTHPPQLNAVLGKLEERNPFMSIRFPPSFVKTHPEAMKNLRTNAHRLTTPFDIHATFEDIVDYKAIMRAEVTQVRSMAGSRNINEIHNTMYVFIGPT